MVKLKSILVLSLIANAVLAALLVFYYPVEETKQASDTSTGAGVTNDAVSPRVIIRKQWLDWSQLESTNYFTYIANLRAIGCPEPTIRDIIVAEINQLYDGKISELATSPRDQWWRANPDLDALETAMQKARELEEEKRQLLNELLGTGWRETPPIPQINPLTGAVFNSLTQEDKNKVQEIARRSQDRIQAYINAQNEAGQPVDPAELTRIRMNTRDELSQILTPTQLEEYLLRYSSTASELRNEMEGLGVGPEKFRAIFRNWDSINQQINLYYSNEDAVSRTNKDIYEQRKLDALKQYLEPEQFNLYMLNQDPVFTETTATAQANDIPADKIIPMYQINSATRDEIQSIENDITLSTEDKLDMIQEIKSEQQKSLLQLLGEERFSRIQE